MTVFERAGSLPRTRSSSFWESIFGGAGASSYHSSSQDGDNSTNNRRSSEELLQFNEGDVLAHQGEPGGDGAYFLVEGQVEVALQPCGQQSERVVDVHVAGDYVADLCAFGLIPRQPATYRARTEVVKAHWLSAACCNALLEQKGGCGAWVPMSARESRPTLISVQNKLKAIENGAMAESFSGSSADHPGR